MTKLQSAIKLAPRHAHDCERCLFLGTIGGAADLWYHPAKDGDLETVIARTGVDGDYESGLSSSYGQSLALTEARRRAVALGYKPFALQRCLVRDIDTAMLKPGSLSVEAFEDLIEIVTRTAVFEALVELKATGSGKALQVEREKAIAARMDEFAGVAEDSPTVDLEFERQQVMDAFFGRCSRMLATVAGERFGPAGKPTEKQVFDVFYKVVAA